jgi:hypothetical protein
MALHVLQYVSRVLSCRQTGKTAPTIRQIEIYSVFRRSGGSKLLHLLLPRTSLPVQDMSIPALAARHSILLCRVSTSIRMFQQIDWCICRHVVVLMCMHPKVSLYYESHPSTPKASCWTIDNLLSLYRRRWGPARRKHVPPRGKHAPLYEW